MYILATVLWLWLCPVTNTARRKQYKKFVENSHLAGEQINKFRWKGLTEMSSVNRRKIWVSSNNQSDPSFRNLLLLAGETFPVFFQNLLILNVFLSLFLSQNILKSSFTNKIISLIYLRSINTWRLRFSLTFAIPFLKMQTLSVKAITCFLRTHSWSLTQTQMYV